MKDRFQFPLKVIEFGALWVEGYTFTTNRRFLSFISHPRVHYLPTPPRENLFLIFIRKICSLMFLLRERCLNNVYSSNKISLCARKTRKCRWKFCFLRKRQHTAYDHSGFQLFDTQSEMVKLSGIRGKKSDFSMEIAEAWSSRTFSSARSS